MLLHHMTQDELYDAFINNQIVHRLRQLDPELADKLFNEAHEKYLKLVEEGRIQRV